MNNTNTFTNLWQGSKENLIMHVITESDSDYETLERHDRYIILNYVQYMNDQKSLNQPFMIFELWIDATPKQVADYSKSLKVDSYE